MAKYEPQRAFSFRDHHPPQFLPGKGHKVTEFEVNFE